VSFGGGIDSTAMLIEMVKRGIKPDLILFSDVGAEKPSTYKHTDFMNNWLIANNFPQITKVFRVDKNGNRLTLEQDCLDKNCLPSIAYGYKKCSLKFKAQPQEKYMNNLQDAKDFWSSGGKIIKFIGINADELRRSKIPEDAKYIYKFPLIDWNMGRDDCIRAIVSAGIPIPEKLNCFFCPSMKRYEILRLKLEYPDLFERALFIEQRAQESLTSVKGLGRSWAWNELIS